jgi:hypothetical protein
MFRMKRYISTERTTGAVQREGGRSRGEQLSAAVLMRSGPAAAIAALGVCALATVLVPAGWWRPAVVVPALVPVGAGVFLLARWVPAHPAAPGVRTPGWTGPATLAVAAGFGVWAGLTHGEHLIIRRDAGSYALFAHWLATRHHLPVDADLAAFGGLSALGIDGFSLASPAFFQVLTGTGGPGPGGATGAHVVPQFLLGAPALYSLGWWPAGWLGLFTVPALAGAFALLAAAGLTARLVGPAWAPVAAATLGLTQPVLHASRATLSEPVALLLVLAAAAVAVDAVEAGRRVAAPGDPQGRPGTRRLAVLAGTLLGLAGLVRVDVLREVALVLPVCAVLALRHHRAGRPLAVSALLGAGVSAVPAWLLSRPYLELIAASLWPLTVGTAGLALATGLIVLLARLRTARPGFTCQPADGRSTAAPGARRLDRVLPPLAGLLVLAAGTALVSRPLWTTVRQSPDDPAVPLIASLQQQQRLPIDGARTYAEQSVTWLVWYVGPVAAVVALVVAAVLADRAVRWWLGGGTGWAPGWLVPYGVALGSVLLTLYRPGITPDHPWADRRLVPVVLPATVIAVTAAAAWAARRAGRAFGRVGTAVTAGAVVLALIGPPAVATWPLANRRTEVGQPTAAAAVCRALRPGDVVVAIEDAEGRIRAQNEWVQVVRGVCGHPSAALVSSSADRPAALARLGALVAGAGGRLVLLAAGEDDESASGSLTALGLSPRRAVLRRTWEDQHLLAHRPDDVARLVVDVWLAVWDSGAGR